MLRFRMVTFRTTPAGAWTRMPHEFAVSFPAIVHPFPSIVTLGARTSIATEPPDTDRFCSSR